MTNKQDWRKISYLRVIIKDRKTPIIKKRDGRTAGGVSLTDETVKPYKEQLASLEAKVKEAKEQMTTVERMDDNTAELTAHNGINTDRIIESVQEGFSKLAPKKFNCVGKCAYIVAKPVGDYYSGIYYRNPTVHSYDAEETLQFLHVLLACTRYLSPPLWTLKPMLINTISRTALQQYRWAARTFMKSVTLESGWLNKKTLWHIQVKREPSIKRAI